jgi:hypothetical protein
LTRWIDLIRQPNLIGALISNGKQHATKFKSLAHGCFSSGLSRLNDIPPSRFGIGGFLLIWERYTGTALSKTEGHALIQ